MEQDTLNAIALLEQGDYTCVICLGDLCHTATERGVKPLLDWLDSGLDLKGFCAADRVVGRGAAFLYCLLEVREVYARVLSRPAREVLEAAGIRCHWQTLTDGIINRRGTGPCPFEAAVMDIQDPDEALTAIRRKMEQM